MKRIIVLLLLVVRTAPWLVGQVVISMQDFDQVSTMTYTSTGGTIFTGSSGSGDRPSNSAFYSSPVNSFGLSNGTASAEFSDNSGLGSFSSKYFEFRLASWSVNSTANGADAADSVTASVSTDGGTTWSKELQVGGNSNACWHYTTGTGLASVSYDGDNSPQLFAPSGGGNRTTDGYSTVRVFLSDMVTQARIRIFIRNNHASELWTIDDVKLIGTPSAPLPLLTVAPAMLTGFSYMSGSGPSASQSYTLNGTDLTPLSGSITVTGPPDYEVSSDNQNFGLTLFIPYSGGTVSQTTVWTRLKAGLTAGTYNETINNSGGGASDAGVSCNGIVTPAPSIYYWTGPDGGDWQSASNWVPVRTSPANDDILHFQDGSTKTILNVPSQTIGQLAVSSNTAITLECTGSSTITISGNAGEDFTVATGSQFNLSGADALKVVPDTGTTARVQGSITLDEGAHRIMAADDSSVTFLAGSIFTAGASFTGAPFGNTSANKNTVLFASGATYISQGGSNPFGLSYPNSVVVFQEGSLYRHEQSGSLSLSGRTYAGFELNYASSFSPAGGNPCKMDDLAVTQGTLNIILTAPDFTINGDIFIAAGQTLKVNPSSAINLLLEGTTEQTISGEGALFMNALSTLMISNPAGVILDKDLVLDGHLEIAEGQFRILPGRSLTVTGTTTLGASECLGIGSDSSGTGSFIDHGITGPGSALVERFLKGGTWHFTCLPVAGTTTTVFSGLYATWFNEPENHYQYILTSDSALNSEMLGYSVMPPTVDVTVEFPGELNTGDKLIEVSRSFVPQGLGDFNGYNLVGNPYCSGVDLSTAVSDWVNTEPTAWFWDSEAGNYKVYPAGAGLSGTHTEFVAPMQGFFVHCNDTSATPSNPGWGQVVFTNDARVHNHEPFLKNPEAPEDLLRVTATTDQNSFSDELSVYFTDLATPAYDPGQDAEKIEGDPNAPQLYTKCNGNRLTINGQPFPASGISVPMGFATIIAGTITLTTTGSENFDPEVSVTLEDLKEDYSQDLKSLPVYSFDFQPGDDPDRFVLHFSKPNISSGNIPRAGAPVIYVAGGRICIDWQEMPIKSGILYLHDLSGREVFSTAIAGPGREPARPHLSSGYYIATFTSDQLCIFRKIYFP